MRIKLKEFCLFIVTAFCKNYSLLEIAFASKAICTVLIIVHKFIQKLELQLNLRVSLDQCYDFSASL